MGIGLAKKFHPDRAPGDTAVEERFKEVQSAWYVIGDPSRRKEFDEHGSLAAPPSTWSPMMWARLRRAKSGDGVLMPNWGTDEPPQWLIAFAPLSVAFLAIVFSARHDIVNMVND